MKSVIIVCASILALSACGESGGGASSGSTASAPAAPAKTAAQIEAEKRTAAAEAERARLASAGLTAPYASEEEWVAACQTAGVDAKICECTGEAAVKQIGVKGLYNWVWEGYVTRDGTARMRSNKFFTDNGLTSEDQQKFADEVGACYTY